MIHLFNLTDIYCLEFNFISILLLNSFCNFSKISLYCFASVKESTVSQGFKTAHYL